MIRRYGLTSVALLVCLLFVVVPLVSLPLSGARDAPAGILGLLSVGGDAATRSAPHPWNAARSLGAMVNSVALATAVTLVDVLVGVTLALVLARVAVPWKAPMYVLSVLPFVVPTFMGALGMLILFGRSGVASGVARSFGMQAALPSVYSLGGIAAVQIFAFFPLVFLPCLASLRAMSSTSLGEQAQVLGADRLFTFASLWLPLVRPALARGALLSFIASISDFGAPMVLLPAGHDLAIVSVYRGMLGIPTNWRETSLTALATLAVVAVVGGVLGRLASPGGLSHVVAGGGRPKPITDRRAVFLSSLVCWSVLAVPVLVLLSLLATALAGSWDGTLLPDSYSLRHLRTALVASPGPVLNSLVIASFVLLLSLPWSVVVAYLAERGPAAGRRVVYPLAVAPFAVPGVILGVTYIQTFNTAVLPLYSTLLLVAVANAVKKSSYCIQPTRASLQQAARGLEEASCVLGGTRLYTTVRVTLPLLAGSVVAGAVLVYISVMHDLGLTLLLVPPEWTPLSLSVYHEIEAGRVFLASAHAVVLTALTVAPGLVAYRPVRRFLDTGLGLVPPSAGSVRSGE